MTKNVGDLYRKVQVETASPAQKIILVYNGIVKNLKAAITAFDDENNPERFQIINDALMLAKKLITELQVALDMEKGGEIAKNLKSLYIFMRRHLSDANIKKDKKMIEDVLSMVEDLLKSWIEAEKKIKAGEE